MMDFDRLDSILKERGISRRALALAVGINENTIATAFKRRSGLSSEDLLKIARYLNVNPYALVDLGEKPERNEGSERNETTMTDTIRNLLQRAIDTHGAQIQIFKAMEEMGELTQALAKLAANAPALLRSAQAPAARGWHPEDAPGLVALAFGSSATAIRTTGNQKI